MKAIFIKTILCQLNYVQDILLEYILPIKDYYYLSKASIRILTK